MVGGVHGNNSRAVRAGAPMTDLNRVRSLVEFQAADDIIINVVPINDIVKAAHCAPARAEIKVKSIRETERSLDVLLPGTVQ